MPIPTPEPGLVISYAYLWHHEHLAGADEGRKDRPAVVTLVTALAGGNATEVTVLPITHRPPDNLEWALEIPPQSSATLDWMMRAPGFLSPRATISCGPATTFARSPA